MTPRNAEELGFVIRGWLATNLCLPRLRRGLTGEPNMIEESLLGARLPLC